MTQRTSLKALAGAALKRNSQRNNRATDTPETTQQTTQQTPHFVARSEGDFDGIRAWLTRIGETDETAIAEVLEKCRNDPEALRYYLDRATETEPTVPDVPDTGRWAPGGEYHERIRSGWRLSRKPDGTHEWHDPGSWKLPEPDEGPTFQRWTVTHTNGRVVEYSTVSGATREEIEDIAKRDGEIASIEPIAEPEPGRTIIDGTTTLPTAGRVAFKLSVPADKVDDIGLVRCADCRHKIATEHPVLVHCGAGIQSPAACSMFWSLDRRVCSDFEDAA